MTAYSVYVESRGAKTVVGLKSKGRNALLRFLNSLHSNPFLEGDYTEKDDIGRPMQELIVGRFAVVYWVDHAVREVKILDLRLAGN